MIVIPGLPVGKPRMTLADKWKRRPCVLRYREWADAARMAAFGNPLKKVRLQVATKIVVRAYFHTEKHENFSPHTQKPDGDNVLKSCCDALFENDQMIYDKHVLKFWTSGEPRIELDWGV